MKTVFLFIMADVYFVYHIYEFNIICDFPNTA